MNLLKKKAKITPKFVNLLSFVFLLKKKNYFDINIFYCFDFLYVSFKIKYYFYKRNEDIFIKKAPNKKKNQAQTRIQGLLRRFNCPKKNYPL